LTSPAFYTQFPRFKLVQLFEYKKEEDEAKDMVLRDFRITTDAVKW
jgi:hypothetical protein